MMPQIDFSTYLSQIFWFCSTFLFSYICVRYIIIPGLESFIGRRTDYVNRNILAAESLISECKEVQSRLEKMRFESRNENEKLINDSYVDFEKNFEAAMSGFKKKLLTMQESDILDVEKKIDDLKKELESSHSEILNAMLFACVDNKKC